MVDLVLIMPKLIDYQEELASTDSPLMMHSIYLGLSSEEIRSLIFTDLLKHLLFPVQKFLLLKNFSKVKRKVIFLEGTLIKFKHTDLQLLPIVFMSQKALSKLRRL